MTADRVSQYTLEGRLVMVWNSASEAASSLNVSRSGITRACCGELKQCSGFRWMRADECELPDIGDIQKEFLYGIMTAGLEVLGRWRTVRAAARELGIQSSLVSKVVNGKRFAWKGVVFVWAETSDAARVGCMSRATSLMKIKSPEKIGALE